MSTLAVGDRVKFLGIDAEAKDRADQGITGTEGMWPGLKAGETGTVNWIEEDDQGRNNPRLFVEFDGNPVPDGGFGALLGMPAGWPILATEVEKVDVEAEA